MVNDQDILVKQQNDTHDIFSVGIVAFVMGLSQISSFFSYNT